MAKVNLPNSPTAQEPKSPRLIFFGTPEYVTPVLDALKNAGHEILAVVTQPPKPVGRKQTLAPSPVALWAQTHGITVFDGKPKEIVEELKSLGAEVGILGAYGQILPPELLTIFPHGILNIHPSLLPKYRGASPVQAAIATGEKQTGVTIIKLDEEVDHGPIVAQFTEDILENDTAGTLRERLFEKASGILVSVLPAYLEGRAELREQEHNKATYTTLLKKEHGFIPPKCIDAASKGDAFRGLWQIPFIKGYIVAPDAQCLERFIRAMGPWPGGWTEIKLTSYQANKLSRRLKILRAHVEKKRVTSHESRVILVPDLVQLEGKNPVSWKEFKKGYPEANF